MPGGSSERRWRPRSTSKGGSSGEIRAIATELAQLAGDRLGDRATAERAWMAVLEVEPDAADAFDALIFGMILVEVSPEFTGSRLNLSCMFLWNLKVGA